MTDKQQIMALMKIEMKLALDRFIQYYKKSSKGVEKIYTDAILSNDPKEVEKCYKKFFGHISQSKFYKEKWKE